MTTPALLAAALLAAAVALALPVRARPGSTLGRRSAPRPVPTALVLAGGAVGTVLVGSGSIPMQALALAGIATVAGSGALALLRRRRARLAAVAEANSVIEACELLASELAAGQPPGRALGRVALDWPRLHPVAEAFRVGADVPSAWRSLAVAPGLESLRVVAAAWQVAHHTGQGLGDAIDRVAVELRAEATTRRVVDGELASARATARLMAALPAVALLMGAGVGGEPWSFLFTTPVGIGSLALGLLLGWVGLWWIEAIARGVERP